MGRMSFFFCEAAKRLKSQGPIFPVGIVGTDEIQPPGARFPRPRRSCSITIGRPIKPERYANRGAELVSNLFKHLEIVARLHAAPAGNDDLG